MRAAGAPRDADRHGDGAVARGRLAGEARERAAPAAHAARVGHQVPAAAALAPPAAPAEPDGRRRVERGHGRAQQRREAAVRGVQPYRAAVATAAVGQDAIVADGALDHDGEPLGGRERAPEERRELGRALDHNQQQGRRPTTTGLLRALLAGGPHVAGEVGQDGRVEDLERSIVAPHEDAVFALHCCELGEGRERHRGRELPLAGAVMMEERGEIITIFICAIAGCFGEGDGGGGDDEAQKQACCWRGFSIYHG